MIARLPWTHKNVGYFYLVRVRFNQNLSHQSFGISRFVNGGIRPQAVTHHVHVGRLQALNQQALQRLLQHGGDPCYTLSKQNKYGQAFQRLVLYSQCWFCFKQFYSIKELHKSRLSLSETYEGHRKEEVSWLSISVFPAVCQTDFLTLTGLTLSSRGMPLLCTAWNCSWLNSVAILSRIWPANKGLYKDNKVLSHTDNCIFMSLFAPMQYLFSEL